MNHQDKVNGHDDIDHPGIRRHRYLRSQRNHQGVGHPGDHDNQQAHIPRLQPRQKHKKNERSLRMDLSGSSSKTPYKIMKDNGQAPTEKTDSLHCLNSTLKEDVELVSTLGGDSEREDDNHGQEDDLDQNDALNYMATPIAKGEEIAALFHPTFWIADGTIEVLERLGCGAYGNVYKVRHFNSTSQGTKNLQSGKIRALKVIRNMSDHWNDMESIHREIKSLRTIISHLPPRPVRRVIVKLLSNFTLKENLCIIYELLGPSLHNVMKSYSFTGFSWKEIRSISYQVCVAVNYIHSLQLIHHDIKPENIVFSNTNFEIGSGMEPRVKLIDFGSTVSANYHNGKVATTIRYRSPEIGLVGLSSFAADVWSLGCVMFELYTTHPLFAIGQDEVEKWYMIEALFCDVIPPKLAMGSGLTCFDHAGKLRYEEMDKSKIKIIQDKIQPFKEYNESPNSKTAVQFFDLLSKMLDLKCSTRIDSYRALHHPFLKLETYSREYDPLVVPHAATHLGELFRHSPRRLPFKLKPELDLKLLR
ncbi:dual specificity protein kinase CLK1 [Folsomia candida]|nr:dual specificity protein kinase CLK1 [Folsomia candida]